MTARLPLRRAAALAALAMRTVPLVAQTIHTQAGTTHNATALTGFATTGAEMGGMLVTAFFTDGTSQSGAWGDLGAGTWGVATPRFSLTLGAASDTYTAPWRFQIDPDGSGINRLLLRGAPGLTVFDIIADPDWLTPGSAQGREMAIVGGAPIGTVATYRNLVAISPNAPLGDLYETLDVTFDVQGGARFFEFVTDTDNIGKGGTITSTPEPATFGLIALGAVAIVGVEWRRRRPA
jgi:hypothetical protein